MAISFNVQKIFKDTWGYNPAVFDVNAQNIIRQPQQSSKMANYFGRDLSGRSYFMPVKLGQVDLPNPVIKVTNKKTIVETALVGRIGTVKELIGQEDYKINIKGIIIMEDSTYPEDMIATIHELYSRNTSLTISSALTNIFLTDNNSVVITDISWPEIAGVQNVKTYEMNLLSDRPFELILK